MTMKIKVQSPTDWTMLADGLEPPSGVFLMIHGYPVKELGMGQVDIIANAYWSPKFKVFIGMERAECLSELMEIDAYHVVYNTKGEVIPLGDPRDPDLY